LEAQFSPTEGGRLVSLTFDGSPNFLAFEKIAPSRQRLPVQERPFQASGGMTVWLAPQSHWWIKQDLFPSRRDRRASWPPDPYGEAADFQVSRPDPSTLTLEGPASAVNGIRLLKSLRFLSPTSALLSLQALNTSPTTQHRALWPNLRLPKEAEIWISGSGKNRRPLVAFPNGIPKNGNAITYYDTFAIIKPATLPPEITGKLQISRWGGSIAIFYRGYCWVIGSQPATKCPPGHESLEIFLNAPLGKNHCTELEPLGNFHAIPPGKTIAMDLHWTFSHLKSTASNAEKRAHLAPTPSVPSPQK
jgi:hypothetical protein